MKKENFITCPVCDPDSPVTTCKECGFKCAEYGFNCRLIPHGAGIKNPARAKEIYVNRLRTAQSKVSSLPLHEIKQTTVVKGIGSRNNRKLGSGILSINMPALVSCDCKACPYSDGRCYAMNGLQAMPNSLEKRLREYRLYKEDPATFEQMIIAAARFDAVVRWFDSGDIVDTAFLEMMIRIAYYLPNTKFYAYTEKTAIVNEYEKKNGRIIDKHPNLVIRFSDNGHLDNPFNHPVSAVF